MNKSSVQRGGFRLMAVVMSLTALLLLSSCRSEEHFGQRKAPRNCHSCTKWGK